MRTLSTCRTFLGGYRVVGKRRKINIYTHPNKEWEKNKRKLATLAAAWRHHLPSLFFFTGYKWTGGERNILRRTYTHTHATGGGWGEPQKWAVLSTWRFFFLTSPPPPHHRGLLAQGGSSLCLVSPPSRWNTTQRMQWVKRFQEFNLFSVLFRCFFRYANPTEKLIQWARSAREFSAKFVIPIVWISNYFAVNFTFFSTEKVTTFAGRRKKNVGKNLFDR